MTTEGRVAEHAGAPRRSLASMRRLPVLVLCATLGCRASSSTPAPTDASVDVSSPSTPDGRVEPRAIAADAETDAVARFEAVARFGGAEWGYVDGAVVARLGGVEHRKDLGELAQDERGSIACAFTGARDAVCIAFEGEFPGRTFLCWRTVDGGEHWTSLPLAKGPFTAGSLSPTARVVFRDPMHGTVTVVDPQQAHNFNVETTWTYATADGGRTWRLTSEKSRCMAGSGDCSHQ